MSQWRLSDAIAKTSILVGVVCFAIGAWHVIDYLIDKYPRETGVGTVLILIGLLFWLLGYGESDDYEPNDRG